MISTRDCLEELSQSARDKWGKDGIQNRFSNVNDVKKMKNSFKYS